MAKRTLKFRSGFEKTLATQLRRSKVKFEYETIKLPYVLKKNYIPDFILDNRIIIEAKGRLTVHDRTKMIAVKLNNPDLDIRFVFQKPFNKIRKNSPTTYAKWAEKNGFPWANERIPKQWLTKRKKSN